MAPLIFLFTQGIAPAAMILSGASQVKPAEVSFSAAVYAALDLIVPPTNKPTTIACPCGENNTVIAQGGVHEDLVFLNRTMDGF